MYLRNKFLFINHLSKKEKKFLFINQCRKLKNNKQHVNTKGKTNKTIALETCYDKLIAESLPHKTFANSNQTKKGKYKITANLRNNKQHAGCKHQTKVNETNQQH